MYPRHRWAVVFGSILFIGTVEGLSDSLLDPLLPFPLNTLLVLGTVAVVAIVAAWYAFRIIDRLMGNLLRRHQQLFRRNAALRAVYGVSLALAGQGDPDEVLVSIMDHARRLLRADATLLVLEGSNGEVSLRAWSAADGVLRRDTEVAAVTGAPVAPSAPASDLARYLMPGHRIGLEIQVGAADERVGTIGVALSGSRQLSESDTEILSALATQAGLALEAARLRDELKMVAVQRERERIAREMHDGLAQVLGYVNTKSQAVEELLADGRTAEAGKQMQELAATARSVYVDVREAILSLSPPVLPERGLASALEEYAARFAESSKLAVRFQATPEADRVALKPEVGAEVFGVAREALTNVRKHAHAHRISVALSVEGRDLLLRIVDDGVGFDVEAAASGPERWPHFGLSGMRERAEAVGGRIRWLSRPVEAGSVVELRVPLRPGGGNGRSGTLGPPGGAASRVVPHQTVQSPVPTHSEAD
jgi:two-component system nitrate/nitrite sensor histidine kinase NarX